MATKEEDSFTTSSGNVYQDLGFKDPEIMLLKAGLARQIHQIMKQRKLKQVDVAKIIGLDQPKISKLIRGQISGYTLDRLFGFLQALSADINVSVELHSVKPSIKPKIKSDQAVSYRKPKRGSLHLLVVNQSGSKPLKQRVSAR